jgi:predicted nucleotidyltransferase
MNSKMLKDIIMVLDRLPVEKAWLFGSFARNGEDS